MKIRKAFQGTIPENKIMDTYSSSNTDTYSCNQVNKMNSYSTTEQVIGTWNGKLLYRKKFEYMGLSANAENIIGTIDNADEVYIEEAHLITTNDAKLSYPLNMVGYAGNTTDKVYVYAQKGNIKVHTTGGWGSNAWKVVVVAKYTKTTD